METTKKLHSAKDLLAAIVMGAEDAIYSTSLDGTITSWNPASERLYGYSAAEAIGNPINLIIPSEYQQEEQSLLEQLQAGKRITHYQTSRVSKEGRRLTISLTVSPLRDMAGKIIGVSKIARDITSEKQQQAEYHRFQIACTRLVGGDALQRPLAPLSPREIEILLWCCQGKTNGVIASILGISKKTVEYHIASIYKKLHVNNRTAAVLRAISLDLLVH